MTTGYATVGKRIHQVLGGYNGIGRPAVAMCDTVFVVADRTDEEFENLPQCVGCLYANASYESFLISEAMKREKKLRQELKDAGYFPYRRSDFQLA